MSVILGTGNLWVNIGIGLAALILLVVSADEVVKRLVGLAHYFGLSTTFVGMTVVSLATSIPEISSHLTASVGILTGSMDYENASAVVLGANIGSDVVQQTLILGIVILVSGGLYFRRYFLWKSLLPMILTAILCLVLGLDRSYSRLDGAILLAFFVGYNYFLYNDERKYYTKDDHAASDVPDDVPADGRDAIRYGVISLVAMSVTMFSATVVLHVTEFVVENTGIAGSLIGVVTLGVASALPELMTAVSGIRKQQHGISMGTLVGSNITNPLLGIGLGSLISTYWAPRPLIAWDLPWQAGAGAILWAILWLQKGKLARRGAIYLILLYAAYLAGRTILFASDAYL